ncbi:E4 SUMO-protein ligase PIAL2-like isoform X3 [Nicotiana tomentosiformis]|uniref:E4 SUMO-protein ligase PIAL2-like isoform X3 n=1 Tax=Nicotiana tomentosiformis TaxID=4098 RepID=UPI00388C52FC
MERPTSSSAKVQNAGTASMLVATVADLMSLYMQSGHLNHLSVFSDLCLSLAKGIDHAVANNEVPLRSHELPSLLKQVYKYRNDFSLQDASMVLLMSVKSACKVGWFRNEDTNDLLILIQEVNRYFSSAEDIGVDPSYVHPYVSKVLRRFSPKLKMDRIVAAFQIKPGFGAFHADFHILRGMVTPEKDEIDSMQQPPTNITKMLKYGVNILQVVGQFNGHYIAVIGIMRLLPSLESHGIKDCGRSLPLACSDLEIVENSSRISLNWPTSNSCQVLNEVGNEVVPGVASANGSWKPIVQDKSVSSQTYSKSQYIKQLRHESKYSLSAATLDKIQMPKPRILVHASVPVTSVKTNAPAGYNQQPQRTFLAPSCLATTEESSEMCSAMVNQVNEQRIDLK